MKTVNTDTQGDPQGVSRRSIIVMGAGTAILLLAPWNAPPALADPNDDPRVKAARRRRDRIDAGWKTPNGWPAEKEANIGGSIVTLGIVGTFFNATLAGGAPALILGHVLARFSAEIRNLESADIVGFAKVKQRRSLEANHASGTAIDILPESYSTAAADVFTAYERRVVRDIVADCQGTVEWAATKNASHFYISVPPSHPRLATLSTQTLRNTEIPSRRVGSWRIER